MPSKSDRVPSKLARVPMCWSSCLSGSRRAPTPPRTSVPLNLIRPRQRPGIRPSSMAKDKAHPRSAARTGPSLSCAVESGPVPSNLARPVDSCHSIRPVQVVGLLEERRQSEEGRIDRQRLASDRATQSGPRRSRRRNRAVFRVKGQSWTARDSEDNGDLHSEADGEVHSEVRAGGLQPRLADWFGPRSGTARREALAAPVTSGPRAMSGFCTLAVA
jgi:hypothetical protein